MKDERCQKCPEGRKNNAIHTECDCKKGHYTGEDEDGPCYGMYLNHFYNTCMIKAKNSSEGFSLYQISNGVMEVLRALSLVITKRITCVNNQYSNRCLQLSFDIHVLYRLLKVR